MLNVYLYVLFIDKLFRVRKTNFLSFYFLPKIEFDFERHWSAGTSKVFVTRPSIGFIFETCSMWDTSSVNLWNLVISCWLLVIHCPAFLVEHSVQFSYSKRIASFTCFQESWLFHYFDVIYF